MLAAIFTAFISNFENALAFKETSYVKLAVFTNDEIVRSRRSSSFSLNEA